MKPTARQVWRQLLDEAGEDEIQAVLSMTDEQVEAELAGHGFDVAKERAKGDKFLQDLASGALEEAMGLRDEKPPPPVAAIARPAPEPIGKTRRRPRTALVLLIAATAAAAAGGA